MRAAADQGLGGLAFAAGMAVCAIVSACSTPSGRWRLQASATTGTAIVLGPGDGDMRIACRRNPADVYVFASRLGRRARGDTVELRSGGHSLRMNVVSVEHGLEATAPITEPFLYMLNGRAPFEIDDGGRVVRGPALDEATRSAFAEACGRAAGVFQPS